MEPSTPAAEKAEELHSEATAPHLHHGSGGQAGALGGHDPARKLTAASAQDPNRPPKLQLSALLATMAAGWYWVALLHTLSCLAAFSRVIPPIVGGASNTAWIFNGFNVVTVAIAPIISYISDMYGRKWLIIALVSFGAVGGAVGCRANNIGQIIGASALIGVASTAIGICTAVPSEVLPHKYRSAGQTGVFMIATIGAVTALVGVGGAIRNDPVNGWRWIYYSLIIAWGAQVPIWWFCYNPPKRDNALTRKRPSLDFGGYILLTTSVVLWLMALTWGGDRYPWKSAQVLGTLISSIVGFTLFGLWEWRGKKDGLLHHDLFKNPNFAWCLVAIGIEGFVYLSYTSVYPGMIATVYEHDLVKAGAMSLPFHFSKNICLPLVSWYIARTRDQMTPIAVGFGVYTLLLLAFVFAKPGQTALVVAMNGLTGLAFELPVVFLTVVGQFAAPAELIGTSTALVLSTRALGGAIGTAATRSVLNQKTKVNIPKYIAAATIPLGLNPKNLGPVIAAGTSGSAKSIQAALAVPGVTMEIIQAAFAGSAKAFSESYKWTFVVIIPVSALGTITCLFLKRNKQQLDYIVDAPLEHIHHKKEGISEAA